MFLEKVKQKLGSKKGAHTLEIVLVIIVLVTLVVIFREQLLNIVNNIFARVNESVNGMF